MVFHWSSSDSKSPQVSRTLLRILADFNNAVVWMVSTFHLISKYPTPFINPSGTVPSTPITIGITVTFMFYSFFFPVLWQGPGTYFSFCFLSVLPCGQPERQSPLFGKFSYFCWLSLGLVAWPRLCDPFISQNPSEVCASHSHGRILGCAYSVCSYN